MPTTTALSDRSIYKTLARISSKNTNSISHGVLRLIQHFKWTKVAIVTSKLKTHKVKSKFYA